MEILPVLILLSLIARAALSASAASSPSPKGKSLSVSDALRLSKDLSGHSFSYEFVSPQKIITGCSGTKFASGETKTQYYVIDATGKQKVMQPDRATEVVFPSSTGLPGLTRTQRVYMFEMCFPSPCNAGTCPPSGSTIGPTGWTLPKFPWFPWGGSSNTGVNFDVNTHGSLDASLSPVSASFALGLGGSAGAFLDKDEEKKPDSDASSSAQGQAQGQAQASADGNQSQASAQASAEASAEAEAASNNGDNSSASADSSSNASASSSSSSSSSPTTTTTTTPVPSTSSSTTTTAPTTSTTTTVPPCNTTTAEIQTTTTEEPITTTTSGETETTTTEATSTSTTTVPSTTSTTTVPSTTSTTTTGTPSGSTSQESTAACNCTAIVIEEPGSVSSSSSASASASASASSASGSGSDCPGACNCCDNCPLSKFIEKLVIAGLGNNWNRGQNFPSQIPTNQWTSGAWNSYSGPAQVQPTWPFFRNDEAAQSVNQKSGKHRTEPTYYAGLPGAIRGQAPVIYYPSCDQDAYFQPAIINYCTGYNNNEKPTRDWDFKRSDSSFDHENLNVNEKDNEKLQKHKI